ncbi:hypothetical protein KFK09_014135 [Dendrobium nobile]|uniref:Uncharacterized protein n=1 Tax=Dendrobium nobile TaxID=94219 RepID=A0A8T3BAU8_DENNO|nr:hypothetical protein KFK09_014135 [Dendrobium nobile]
MPIPAVVTAGRQPINALKLTGPRLAFHFYSFLLSLRTSYVVASARLSLDRAHCLATDDLSPTADELSLTVDPTPACHDPTRDETDPARAGSRRRIANQDLALD